MPGRRVVVTGIGAITPLGTTFSSTLSALRKTPFTSPLQSLASIFPPDSVDRKLTESNPCQVAAPVVAPDLAKDHPQAKSRFLQFALSSSSDALTSASLFPSEHDTTMIGCAIGTGIGSISSIITSQTLLEKSLKKVSPHFVPSVLCNSASGLVSVAHNLRGPNHSASTACATGAHAIVDGYKFIRDGDADVMLAGGAEGCIDALSLAGFSRLRAMSTKFNDVPGEASRPFDKNRDGFVMGEGACLLVLEEAEFAKKRGARILCEITGYGVSGDAHHATAPHPDGDGAERSMRMALQRGGVKLDDVAYVNAHATSTPLGDDIEIKAISRIKESEGSENTLYVSSTKGATGHLLGAAGSIEAAFTIMALHDGKIPDTKNLADIHVGEYDTKSIEIVKDGEGVDASCEHVMSNSFGFGGTNCCLLFSKFKD
jgi:3-oxoacyl-[acyl-carrier-protein] synthase II